MTKLENDEVILLEVPVLLGRRKQNSLLSVTNKRLVFSKKVGLFQKKDKIVDTILIEHIKVYNGKVYMKQKKNSLILQTVEGKETITFQNIIDSTRVMERIKTLRLGDNLLTRTNKKVKHVGYVMGGIAGLTISIAAIPEYGKTIIDNTKKIVSAIKSFKK